MFLTWIWNYVFVIDVSYMYEYHSVVTRFEMWKWSSLTCACAFHTSLFIYFFFYYLQLPTFFGGISFWYRLQVMARDIFSHWLKCSRTSKTIELSTAGIANISNTQVLFIHSARHNIQQACCRNYSIHVLRILYVISQGISNNIFHFASGTVYT